MGRSPVVVGHGVGALVAEILLARDEIWAAAAIEPTVLRGAMPLSWRQLVAGTIVLGPGFVTSGAVGRPVAGPGPRRVRWTALAPAQFQLLFGTAGLGRAVEAHGRWSIPSPAGPLIDAATGGGEFRPELDRAPAPRGRHLVVAFDPDRLTPRGLVRTNLGSHDSRPAVRRITGRGQSLFLDHTWVDVAHSVVSWLNDVDPHPHPRTRRAAQKTLTGPQLVVHNSGTALEHALRQTAWSTQP